MRRETPKDENQINDRSEDRENLYDYASSPRVADHLEGTQTGRFGTKGGTGFAAEDANAMHDRWSGKTVDHVGKSNELNGADRIVDGIGIQTKYYSSAARTVGEAFDAAGIYRYGEQLLEVPRDQYDKAVDLMREKIAEGKVPGVTNPDDATKIVKEGSVTYQQARNIARGGNIDSIKYDTKNQAVTSGYAFAISFGICYARSMWDGKSHKEALKDAAGMGLASAATSFFSGVVTAQLMRTTLARQGTVLARHGVKAAAKTELGKKAINAIAKASLGKSVSGVAAVNHVSKLLRTNVITGTVTTVVITSPDLYRAAVKKNTSWAQVSKNLIINGTGVGAGLGGWAGGAAAGAALGSVVPVLGTAAGAVAGGIIGAMGAGVAGSYASKKILDQFIQDDAEEMRTILGNDVLPSLGNDFLLSTEEFGLFMDEVSPVINVDFLRGMYACSDRLARIEFAYDQLEDYALNIVKKRATIVLPTEKKVQQFVAEMIDSAEEALLLNDDSPVVGLELEDNESVNNYKPNFTIEPSNIATVATSLPITPTFLAKILTRRK